MPIYVHIDICYLCCSPECVSRGVLQMIREAPNGSLWVSEEEKPLYQVIIPSRQSLRDEWIIYGKIRQLRIVLGNEAFHWLPNRWHRNRHGKTLAYNYSRLLTLCRPGSVVGIATACGFDDPGIESRCGEIFRTSPGRSWGPPSLLYNGYRVSPRGKVLPGRDVDTSHPSNPEV